MSLEFIECEQSGHLKADGAKGQYWVFDMAWKYVELVNPTPAGPAIEKLGAFRDLEDAKQFAAEFDRLKEVA